MKVGMNNEEKTMKAGVIAATLTFLLVLAVPAVSFAGAATDSDGDGVFDWFDNCLNVSNTAQVDSNGDGCGNRCDADADNNGVVGAGDFALWKAGFGNASPGPPFNPDVDFDVSGVIGAGDFAIWKSSFGGPPGPSGTTATCP